FRNRLYTLFKLGFIICRSGYILAGGDTGRAEDKRKYNSHDKVEDNRGQSLKHTKFLSTDGESENSGRDAQGKHPYASYHTRCPTGDQSPAVEPAGIETQEHRGQRLYNYDAAEELEVDDIGSWNEKDEQECTELD